MIAISKFKFYSPECATLQQLYIVRIYLLVLARQSKSEHIKLVSESEIKAGSAVIYSLRQWRHLWITIAKH